MIPRKTNYATKNGKLIHVEQVPVGINKGVICPACKTELIAKNQGKIVAHHFAHQKHIDCSYGYSETIQLLAIEIIKEEKMFAVPAVKTRTKGEITLYEPKILPITKIGIVKRNPDAIPMLVLEVKKKTSIILKIKASEGLYDETENKHKKWKYSTILMDVSEFEPISKEKLKDLIVNSVYKKVWKYNKKLKLKEEEFENKSEKFSVREYNNNLITTFCPIKKREKNQKGYAIIDKDCFECPNFYDYNEREGRVSCLGRYQKAEKKNAYFKIKKIIKDTGGNYIKHIELQNGHNIFFHSKVTDVRKESPISNRKRKKRR